MWFQSLMGFHEKSPEQVRENCYVEGTQLISKVNGASYQFGSLELISLKELKAKAPKATDYNDRIKLSEIIGDVQALHYHLDNENALFQAASQFNLLEMVGPHVTPERGVGIYENDHTQGPACAIACGAGTIYRNYFVPVNGHVGQSANHQIDCLEAIGKLLSNEELQLWKMTNGYAMMNKHGLHTINQKLHSWNQQEKEALKELLKVGIQWDTEVSLYDCKRLVNQIYCSALPVAYSNIDWIYWENFARLILEATYEATFHAALINMEKTGCNKLFLTLVGGGAFGNEQNWILDALKKTIILFQNTPLDVCIVSYSQSNSGVQKLIAEMEL